MKSVFQIEDIEELRRAQGIEDVLLRQEIRGLKTGDIVKLTFASPVQASVSETLSVRITSVRGYSFRGKLTSSPVSAALAKLRVGTQIVFTSSHIHSIPKAQPAHV